MGQPLVVVTGGGHGLGRSACLRYAADGYAVAVLDIEADAGGAVAREIRERGGAATSFETDVGSEASVERAVDAVMDEYGRVDVLINNASIIHRGTLETLSLHQWEDVIRVNLTGCFIVSKAVTRHMMRAVRAASSTSPR